MRYQYREITALEATAPDLAAARPVAAVVTDIGTAQALGRALAANRREREARERAANAAVALELRRAVVEAILEVARTARHRVKPEAEWIAYAELREIEREEAALAA
jgi:hypothetical protein